MKHFVLVNEKDQPIKSLDEAVVQPDGSLKGKEIDSGGLFDTDVDKPLKNWKAWNQTISDMGMAMDAFKSACPCACDGKATRKE